MSSRAERRAKQTEQRAAKVLGRLTAAATTVYLIRHGETAWNVEHRLQGQLKPGPPLNGVGLQQAAQVARHLKDVPVAAVYSSDLQRAVQSAALLADVKSLQVVQDAALRERNLGQLEGLTRQQAMIKVPDAFACLMSGRRDMRIPGGGESVDDLQQRASKVVARLASHHPGQSIALTVHGGFLTACYRQATSEDCPTKNVNAAVNIVKVEGDAWALVSWGETVHLQKTGFLHDAFGGGSSDG